MGLISVSDRYGKTYLVNIDDIKRIAPCGDSVGIFYKDGTSSLTNDIVSEIESKNIDLNL